jgi:sugar transferase (PEP-CTERM/EpsH1 system associated)
MKIAFLAARPPYPLDGGGRIRTFHLLKEVSREHDVTLITATAGPADESALSAVQEAIPRIRALSANVGFERSWRRYFRALRNPIDSLPYTWTRYRHPRFTALVRETLRKDRYDVVHCDHVQVAHTLEGLTTPPRLLNAHNIETKIVQRLGHQTRVGWRRLAIRWQAAKTLKAERRALQLFDRCVAVSDEDAAELRRMAPGTAVSVVPNGVDLTYFTPRPGAGGMDDIVFPGAMDWLPNIDGVSFFVREVLPRIKQRHPRALFWIVGRNPSDQLVRRLAGDSVRFTGSVDDVRPHLRQARAVVVPLRIGGGTRLKILEAWALGKPVVSTTLGAEGLPDADGENIALADTPDIFAERVVGLLNDADACERLGAAGRRIVEERFGWDRVARALVEAYRTTCADGQMVQDTGLNVAVRRNPEVTASLDWTAET